MKYPVEVLSVIGVCKAKTMTFGDAHSLIEYIIKGGIEVHF